MTRGPGARRRGPFARAALAAALAALSLLALSCQPGGGKRTVVFWQFWTPEIIEPLITNFEEENPGIDVHMEQLTWGSGLEKIIAAIDSGGVPDLCELGSTWMPRILEAGALVDWSAGLADLRPTMRGWSLCSIGDAVYGVPWALGTRALFYNKTLFARAGLDSSRAPETWDELYSAAAAIDRLVGGVNGYGVQGGEGQILFKKFMPFAWGNGGDVLNSDLTQSVFDSQRNLEALEFYLRLKEVGVVERQSELDRMFKEGKIGLQIAGAWLFRSIPTGAPNLRYGVALVPRPSRERGTHASFAGGELLVSFNASKNKEDALKLARFLVRPENALALAAAAQSVQPATLGADTMTYYRERPNERVMLRQFETAYTTPNHPAWDGIEAAIEDEVGQALYGRKSAAQAVADAHARIQALAGQR
jgi:multiple sugar transport system substrate-binding protein